LGTVKISFSERKIACVAAERFSNSSTPPAVLNACEAGYRGTNLLWITQKRAHNRDRALAPNDFDLCSTKTFCCEPGNYKLSPWSLGLAHKTESLRPVGDEKNAQMLSI